MTDGLVFRDRVFLGGSVFDGFRLAGGSSTSGRRWGVAFDRKEDDRGEKPGMLCNGSSSLSGGRYTNRSWGVSKQEALDRLIK